jgi:hypothetical protein
MRPALATIEICFYVAAQSGVRAAGKAPPIA